MIYSTSTDGITWTTRTKPPVTGVGPIKIVAGGSTFLMYGGGSSSFGTSTNGTSWTMQYSNSILDGCSSVAWNGTLFVAAINPGSSSVPLTCATSPDGQTWTTRTVAAAAQFYNDSWVTAAGTTFVMVTWFSAYTSTNGIAWTARTFTTSSTINSISAMGTTVLVGFNGTFGGVQRSTDSGATWGAQIMPVGSRDWIVSTTGTAFIAGDRNAAQTNVYSSASGTTGSWTSRTLASGVWGKGAASGTIFILMRYTGGNVGSSTTGLATPTTWTAVNYADGNANGLWSDVAWSGSNFCAISQNASTCATSPDGITWTSRPMPLATAWISIAWNGSVFCAVSSSFSITIAATSPTGAVWTQRTLLQNSQQVAGSAGVAMFAAAQSSSNNAPQSSATGTTWANSVSGGTRIEYLGVNATGFLGICTVIFPGTHTSTDGSTWTAVTHPSVTSVGCSIASNNTLWVVLPLDAANNSIFSSTNGAAWTTRTLPSTQAWKEVIWNGAKFFAIPASGTAAALSSDGITWTAATLTGSGTRDCAASS